MPIVRALGALVLGLALLGSALVSTAYAERRVALVIGNDGYRYLEPLQKARGDAQAMGETLKRIGFATTVVTDLDRDGFANALDRFTSDLQRGDTAFLFYAGHGVEVGGINYLLPVDMPKIGPDDRMRLARSAYALPDIVKNIRDRAVKVTVAVIDACRDNPFPNVGARSVGGTRGLARMEAVTGEFLLFSAGAGETALDRLSDTDREPTSVFTRVLLRHLPTPGLSFQTIAKRTASEVKAVALARRGHTQFPDYSDRYDGDLIIFPASIVAAPTVAERPRAPVTAPSAAQRAVLYEENQADPRNPRALSARVVWHLDAVNASQGQPPEAVVKASIETNEPGLALVLTLRVNRDPKLPASHIVELSFTTPKTDPPKTVKEIGLLQFKDEEGVRGTPLAGLPVPVRDNLFLFGLSNLPAEIERNVGLIQGRKWVDLPMRFSDSRRAILTFEKGEFGEQVIQEALRVWK